MGGRMRSIVRTYLARHEPPIALRSNIRAGLAAAVGIALVGLLADQTELPLLIAPLGATVGLLFGQPTSPVSQPINVMGGYLIGTILCEITFWTFPGDWLVVGLAVGLSIVLMRAARVTHPPAAALPILGVSGAVHGVELFLVVFLSSVLLIALAVMVHRLPPKRQYPTLDG